MAVTAKAYGKGAEGQYGGTAARRIDWAADTIKVALVANTYTPDQDAHDFWDDVDQDEVATGNGYTTGGAALAGKSVVYTGGTNVLALKANATTWTALTKTFRYGVVYKDTGTPSTSPLLGYVDFGADQAPAGVDFTITWDATDGVLKLTVA